MHAPATLHAEVQSMLADARSTAFATSFPRQWLQLRQVGMFPPDKELYPDHDENLEQSMIAETVAFFGEVLRGNGPLRDFLDSDWTMMNERLAMHYGIPGIRVVLMLEELHRSDPNCTACHNTIAPLGIAFDNYDAIGRWRTVETIKDGTGANPALDPSGQLPDGRAFKDSLELRQLLATYALRLAMTFGDRESLTQIAEEAKKSDYQLTELIEGLVESPLFLKR